MDTFRDSDYQVRYPHRVTLYRPNHLGVSRGNIFVRDHPSKSEIWCSSEWDTINFAFAFVCHSPHFLQQSFCLSKTSKFGIVAKVQHTKEKVLTQLRPWFVCVSRGTWILWLLPYVTTAASTIATWRSTVWSIHFLSVSQSIFRRRMTKEQKK